MNPYALIDLTATRSQTVPHKGLTPDTLDDPDRVLSLNAIPSDVHWHSFMPSSSRISTAGRLPSITTKQTVTILTARWKNFMTASPPAAPLPICKLHGMQERRLLF